MGGRKLQWFQKDTIRNLGTLWQGFYELLWFILPEVPISKKRRLTHLGPSVTWYAKLGSWWVLPPPPNKTLCKTCAAGSWGTWRYKIWHFIRIFIELLRFQHVSKKGRDLIEFEIIASRFHSAFILFCFRRVIRVNHTPSWGMEKPLKMQACVLKCWLGIFLYWLNRVRLPIGSGKNVWCRSPYQHIFIQRYETAFELGRFQREMLTWSP